jgi:glycosyltransferase involved in cell wall biosynthesis
MEPLVSVVVITHNRPSLLLNAIQSVRNQTYKHIEIIVVDDCSSVDIGQTVLSYDPVIRVVRNPTNSGPSCSRNRGIDDARGDVIAFLDDDDEWLPNKLDEQVSLLHEADACLCGYRVRETGEDRTRAIANVTARHLRQGNRFCGASGLVARRHVFDKIRFDEALWIGEDWDVYVQIIQEFHLRNVNKPLFLYRRGGQQSLSNQFHEDDSKFVVGNLARLEKNRAFLGEFYFGVRIAGSCLRFIGTRGGRIRLVLSTMRRAGVLPTLYCLCQKAMYRNGRRFFGRGRLRPN